MMDGATWPHPDSHPLSWPWRVAWRCFFVSRGIVMGAPCRLSEKQSWRRVLSLVVGKTITLLTSTSLWVEDHHDRKRSGEASDIVEVFLGREILQIYLQISRRKAKTEEVGSSRWGRWRLCWPLRILKFKAPFLPDDGIERCLLIIKVFQSLICVISFIQSRY